MERKKTIGGVGQSPTKMKNKNKEICDWYECDICGKIYGHPKGRNVLCCGKPIVHKALIKHETS